MAWQEPKTNWSSVDGVTANDLNRIEGNTKHLRDNVGGAKRPATVVVGTSTSGHTVQSVDYLCDGTNDHEEINAAIAALPSSGGKIIILNGSYNLSASIIVNKPNVTIEGSGYATVIGSAASTVLVINSARCNVRGLYVAGQNIINQIGIDVAAAATRCEISDCVISDTDTCIKISGTYCAVHSNKIDYGNIYGVSVQGSYATIKDNLFSNCLISVRVYYVSGVIVKGNTIHTSGAVNGYGVNLINSDTCVVSNNIIRSAHVGIEVYSYPANSTYCSVDSNLVIECTNGIQLSNAHDNSISCNLVQNEAYTSTSYSMYISGSNRNAISCNRLIGKTYNEVMSTGNSFAGNLTV